MYKTFKFCIFWTPNIAYHLKDLMESHPILMHVLVASMTKDDIGDVEVCEKSNNYTESVISGPWKVLFWGKPKE